MLEFSWPAFAFAIVNFLILAGLLYRFLHKPVLDVLEQRRQRIAAAEKTAAEKTTQAQRSKEEFEAKTAALQEERNLLLSEARKVTEKARENVLAAAKKEADKNTQSRLNAFERERRDALTDLQSSIADVALETARAILLKTVDADVEARLQDLLLRQLRAAAKAQSADPEPTATSNAPTAARISSARELPASDREALAEALGPLGFPPDALEFTVDPQLLAGSRVEFSDRAVDASLGDVLQTMKEQVTELAGDTAREDDS